MTTPEDLLRETLRDRVDGSEHPRTPLADVVSAAGAIRRRRRAVGALVAAAAVVAITVSTAAVVSRDRSNDPLPGTNLPTSVPTDSASATTSALADLSTGPPPAIGYVEDYEYVAADGSRTPLPRGYGVSGIAPCGAGFLVSDTRYFEGTSGLAVVDDAGNRGLEIGTTGPPVTSHDGELVAWASYTSPETGRPENPVVHVAPVDDCTGGETSRSIGFGAVVNGFLGQELVFSGMFGRGGVFITDLMNPPRQIPGLRSVGGVDSPRGLVSGQSASSDGDTGVIVEAATGDVKTSIDGWQLGAFSPDGRYVAATQGRLSTPPVAIFDATTGDLVSEMFGGGLFEPTPGAVAWEDDTHLLIVVDDHRHLAIVRAGLDGSLSLATGPGPKDTNYVFAARP